MSARASLRIYFDTQVTPRTWSYSLTGHGPTPEGGAIDSLDTLARVLGHHGELLADLPWTELPTFGGPPPSRTTEVWSWDARRLLVGTRPGLLRLIPRDTSST